MPVRLGTPTSIGSLPYDDPEQAVTFVLTHLPELPSAPTLPARDPREGMIAQAAWGIAGVEVAGDGTISVAPGRLDAGAPVGDPTLDGPPFVTLRAFLSAIQGRTSPVKVQVTGPVTLARALVAGGAERSVALAVAGAAVRARARSVLDATVASAPEAPIVCFLDEPGLIGGPPSDLAEPDALIDLVSGVLAVWEPHAITGVHCCGASDWRALLQAGPRVLSAPVGTGFAQSAGALASFLERDGWIAWGAVPTDRPLGDSVAHCWRDLSAEWCELVQAGCDPVRIRQQALVTPACGLALHHHEQVERVLELSRSLGQRIQDQLTSVRLSVGA
jgi:methionine synthase II (cobalamin-independent)